MISLWTIPAFPLFGAIICLLVHFLRIRSKAPTLNRLIGLIGWVGTFFVALSFGASIWWTSEMPPSGVTSTLGEWICVGSLSIPIALHLDQLSATLCLVITGVGTLIHLYSIDYMKEDPGKARYFACLSLFVAAMLLLVLADNLPLLFVGWEGVGLCSYLLIGFWYEKSWPAEAGQKAFVVNRIGDLGFLLGIFYLFSNFGPLDFGSINQGALSGEISGHTASIAALLLFTGAIGKSAQIPLFVWLPDAMAGPTPVSALIHAATMVTAGVYLVCRLSGLFAASAVALTVVAVVGVATALIAATMALVERDIKKVLAYSTISQLGFMFLGAGVGAFHASIFHLVTHSFFKALLFLAAGSVIHAMGGEQDIWKMGGLRKKIPLTHAGFLIGALALAGFPFLSGFMSKDAILWHTVKHNTLNTWILWGLASGTALLTAAYSFRLYLLVFHGKERFGASRHPHESPHLMTRPLLVLLVLSVFGGFLFHWPIHFDRWIGPVFSSGWSILARSAPGNELLESREIFFVLISAGIALLGLLFAAMVYSNLTRSRAEKVQAQFPGLHKLWSQHYWVDWAYNFFIVSPLKLFSIACSLFDLFVIDGLVNLCGSGATAAGNTIRRIQTGHLQNYAVWIGMGAVAILAIAWIL